MCECKSYGSQPKGSYWFQEHRTWTVWRTEQGPPGEMTLNKAGLQRGELEKVCPSAKGALRGVAQERGWALCTSMVSDSHSGWQTNIHWSWSSYTLKCLSAHKTILGQYFWSSKISTVISPTRYELSAKIPKHVREQSTMDKGQQTQNTGRSEFSELR